jgi:CheY-like chemotaxis protein
MDKPLRILYVEDNLLVREVTAELLALEGREITAVASAEEALTAYAQEPAHLVITDVSLPSMSGLDLARQLRKIDPDLPMIVASGYSLNLGAAEFGPHVRSIIKPFDSEAIDALIGELTQPD